MGLTQPYPDELKSYVLEGVWTRYDVGQWSNLKWTLGNLSAIIVMVGVTSLIALAQTQCWAIIRYIITQFKKSVRMADTLTPDPLLELSQGKAIKIFLPWLSEYSSRLLARIRCRERNTDYQDEPVESPIFGIASTLVILIFLVIGGVVPYLLTEGALGAPIVMSKITEDCINSEEVPEHLLDVWNRQTRADGIFALCQDELNAGCDSPYWLSEPQITKTCPTICPFDESICFNNAPSFQITHSNISAFEMGVNSQSKLRISHRLTCSPISLRPFQWGYQNASIIYIQQLHSDTIIRKNVSLVLSTKNGPNEVFNEHSGALMYEANGPRDLTVLPRNLLGFNQFEPLKLNKLLQRNDARPFLVIYRAGNVQYVHDTDDPFFSAHNIISPGSSLTCADYEATSLGCVEQFQYCFTQSQLPIYCTDWGVSSDQYLQMLTYLATRYFQDNEYNGSHNSLLEHSNNQYILSFNEMANFFKYFESRFGVYEYLSMRIENHNMVPLRQRKSLMTQLQWLDSDSEQWIFEVETWFMKAYLSGILTVQDSAMFAMPNLTMGLSPEYIRKWKLCGRILFRNPDFTNINWIGLWITCMSLLPLILIGNQIKRIHQGLKYCAEGLRRLKHCAEGLSCFKYCAEGLRRLKTLAGYLWHSRSSVRQAGRVFNMALLFQSLSRVRPWDSDSTRQNETSSATEMGVMEVITARPIDDGSSTDEYYEIDNPP